MLNVGPKVPQAHTRHHHHLELAELVWFACLEATDVPYALTVGLRASDDHPSRWQSAVRLGVVRVVWRTHLFFSF